MNVHAAALAKAYPSRRSDLRVCRRRDRRSRPSPENGCRRNISTTPPARSCSKQITVLPEYYPTRTELGILRDRGGEIAAIIPEGAALVEFGAGATTKVRLLLEHCEFAAYVPVDISGDFLKAQADGLRKDFPVSASIRSRPTSPRRSRCPTPVAGNAEGRLLPGLDARQFRAERGLGLPAQRARHPRPRRADDHRRRPREGRARAVRRL